MQCSKFEDLILMNKESAGAKARDFIALFGTA